MATGSTAERAGWFAGIMFTMFMIIIIAIAVVMKQEQSWADFVMMIGIFALIYMVIVAAMTPFALRLVERQHAALAQRLGVRVIDRNMLTTLRRWFRYGEVPKKVEYRKVLPAYLDYLDDIATGRLLPVAATPKARRNQIIIGVVLIMLWGVNIVIQLLDGRGINVFYVGAILLWSFSLCLQLRSGKGRNDPIQMRLNRKMLRTIAERRASLNV